MKQHLFKKLIIIVITGLFFITALGTINVLGFSEKLSKVNEFENKVSVTFEDTECWALLFAVGIYKDNPDQDRPSMLVAVEELYDVLLDSPQWKEDNIHKVTANECTGQRLIDEFKWLKQNVGEGDQVLIYLTTHGFPLEDSLGRPLDIIPKDEEDGADEALKMYEGFANPAEFVHDDIINYYISQMQLKGGGICLIVDSCFSGGFNDATQDKTTYIKPFQNLKIFNRIKNIFTLLKDKINMNIPKTIEIILNLFNNEEEITNNPTFNSKSEKFTQEFIDDIGANGRIVLMSSEEDTVSWGSYFSSFLINSLDTGNWADIFGNQDGINSAEEAFVYAKPRTEEATDYRQHPTILDKYDGEFLLTYTLRDPIFINLPNGVPDAIPPGQETTINIEITEISDILIQDSCKLYYRNNGGIYSESILNHISGDLYEATLPAAFCSDTPEYYFSVEGQNSGIIYKPSDAPNTVYSSLVGELISVLVDNFETNQGWTVENSPSLVDGAWERGTPIGGGIRGDPIADYDGSGKCYLTDNEPGNSDVDDGITWLISPTMDLSFGEDALIKYALWYTNDFGNDPNNDLFKTYLSNDNGANWVLAETIGPIPPDGWNEHKIMISDYISPTNQVKIRFEASDLNDGSVVEAGIDAFMAATFECN